MTTIAAAAAPRRRVSAAQEVVDAHRAEDTGELFGIAELCAEFGITLRAIRFYEDKGLLAPRRINGTRVYTRKDRQIQSLESLKQQVDNCGHMAKVELSPTEQQSIVKYLNDQFYRFRQEPARGGK